jgi:hypothetical protein
MAWKKSAVSALADFLGFLPMERLSLNHGQTQSRAKNCLRQICIYGYALIASFSCSCLCFSKGLFHPASFLSL